MPERLDLQSQDVLQQRKSALLEILPEARGDGATIDVEKLRLALGLPVDVGRERYGLWWPGKAECFRTIQAPSTATLRPAPDDSASFEQTQNVFIEGDNLEVLKVLQKAYIGTVKLIYIDPPYNTGNDFVYPDDYAESLQTYLQYTAQVDTQGRKFSTNTDTDGRFHSKWLSMMYPRLFLARNLLRDDGVIFVTIDDTELAHLKLIMSEIFGEENFVAQIEWQKRYTRSNNTNEFTSVIDHILVYRKSPAFSPNLLPRDEDADARYSNPDNDPRGPWKSVPFLNPLSPEERPNLAYDITNPFTKKVIKPTRKAWRSEKSVFEQLSRENRIWWGKEGTSELPNVKRFLSEVKQGITPINFWAHDFADNTDVANREVNELLGDKVFDTPKPTRLIRRMLEVGTEPNAGHIVLDFFAGSASTGDAVLRQNAEDGGNRRYILVQLPEPTPDDSVARKKGYENIAEIARARLRYAAERLAKGDAQQVLGDRPRQDRGFRAFTLDDSNFLPWEASTSKDTGDLQRRLLEHVSHIRTGRKDDDLLFEILIKSGFSLTTPFSRERAGGTPVVMIAEGALIVALGKAITIETIHAIADRQPVRIVCLDEAFQGSDELKTNAAQLFKTRGVTSFRTV